MVQASISQNKPPVLSLTEQRQCCIDKIESVILVLNFLSIIQPKSGIEPDSNLFDGAEQIFQLLVSELKFARNYIINCR